MRHFATSCRRAVAIAPLLIFPSLVPAAAQPADGPAAKPGRSNRADPSADAAPCVVDPQADEESESDRRLGDRLETCDGVLKPAPHGSGKAVMPTPKGGRPPHDQTEDPARRPVIRWFMV
ncbi:hypothetical protein [Breoghania sp.]|uniref:hypothetical protein n=1 Tax=Breoghania sp. TaxID=2065378 RepID=UPI002624AB87|nr:hypothetical protein [Breoghania sp.]MDJ0933222.1 hypothetical protein [Breoghania sp.]